MRLVRGSLLPRTWADVARRPDPPLYATWLLLTTVFGLDDRPVDVSGVDEWWCSH